MLEILAAIGEDPARPGLVGTPNRIATAYGNFFAGLARDPLEPLAASIDFSGAHSVGAAVGRADIAELVLLRDIEFRSICEHHLLPFYGVAHLAYLPNQRIVVLGALPMVVETLSARPQLQERLTEEIADALQTGLDARGVLVVLDATHGCVTARGSRQTRSTIVTLASRGILSRVAERTEIMTLIGVTR